MKDRYEIAEEVQTLYRGKEQIIAAAIKRTKKELMQELRNFLDFGLIDEQMLLYVDKEFDGKIKKVEHIEMKKHKVRHK